MARVTINSIAERAGVSRGTVDRVLHKRAEVAPDVRERVLSVAKILGYIDRTDADGRKKRKVGIILPGNHWFDTNLKEEWSRGVADAVNIVEPLGYEVRVRECETDMPYEVLDTMRELCDEGADGLIMTTRSNDAVVQCINDMEERGIPVITYNSDISGSRRRCFVGQNLYQSGRVAANLAALPMRRGGHVLVVAGNLEFEAHRQRVQGFLDKCGGNGVPAERIEIRESHNEYMLTSECVKKSLEKHEDLSVIYMANESVAACAEAVASAGRRGEIMVIGNDLTRVSRRLLADDAIDFILTQNIYWQGFRPVMIMKKILEMPEIPVGEDSFTDIGIATADNI